MTLTKTGMELIEYLQNNLVTCGMHPPEKDINDAWDKLKSMFAASQPSSDREKLIEQIRSTVNVQFDLLGANMTIPVAARRIINDLLDESLPPAPTKGESK